MDRIAPAMPSDGSIHPRTSTTPALAVAPYAARNGPDSLDTVREACRSRAHTKGSRYTLRTAAAIASHASRSTRRDEATFMRMRPSPPAP